MQQKTILIVDDEPEFIQMLQMRLEANGYAVLVAEDAKEGLKIVHDSPPDLILLDLIMPDMDGGDFAQALRADPGVGSVPIVFLTAAVSEREVTRADGVIGGEVFVSKNAHSSYLLEQIQKALE